MSNPSTDPLSLLVDETGSLANENDNHHKIKCYVFSDIHLNSYTYYHNENHTNEKQESPRQKNFCRFLNRIYKNLSPQDELLIILNGDILDINESWVESPEPWADDRKAVEKVYLKVLGQILENNQPVVEALKPLLARSTTKIIYVIGNHDYLLEEFSSGHQLVRERLLSDLPEELQTKGRIEFVSHYENKTLGLYAEHGHKLDPFNAYNFTQFPPLGEIINVAIVNKLHTRVVDRLKEAHYKPHEIEWIKGKLKQIEYLRPLALFPLWVEKFSSELPVTKVKRPSVEQLIRESLLEIVNDRHILAFFVTKLKIPAWALLFMVRLALTHHTTLPVLSYIVSRFFRTNHSNQFQYQHAIKMQQKTGMQLMVFGHTHKPSAKPLGKTGYYFNTGSWKPVINFVKARGGLPFEEEFIKIEHWGVLRIEKRLDDPTAKTEYFLETVKNGHVD